MDKVCVFIDGSNFYHGLKAAGFSTKVNYHKLGVLLANGRQLVRVYYYNAHLSDADDPDRRKAQQRFFDILDKTDYLECRFGKLVKRTIKARRCMDCNEQVQPDVKCPKCGAEFSREYRIEKGIDVRLAVDMLHKAAKNNYDTAILISGDGDFKDAVQAVKDLGKHVEGAFFSTGTANALRRVVDKSIPLDKDVFENCRP